MLCQERQLLQCRHDVQQPGPGLPDVPGPCCVVGSLSKVIISSILTYVLIEIQKKIKMTMTMNGMDGYGWKKL